jgi:hypothetical protein
MEIAQVWVPKISLIATNLLWAVWAGLTNHWVANLLWKQKMIIKKYRLVLIHHKMWFKNLWSLIPRGNNRQPHLNNLLQLITIIIIRMARIWNLSWRNAWMRFIVRTYLWTTHTYNNYNPRKPLRLQILQTLIIITQWSCLLYIAKRMQLKHRLRTTPQPPLQKSMHSR